MKLSGSHGPGLAKLAGPRHCMLCLLLAAALLTSCGGGKEGQSTLLQAGPEPQLQPQAQAEDAGGMPQLPQPFEGENSPVRESSDDSLLVSGDSFVYENGERGAEPSLPGNFALMPGWHQQSAYALYSFEAAATERPVMLEVEAGIAALPNGDEFPLEYYAAVSDYSRGGWKTFGPFTDDASIVLNSETERQRLVDSDYRTHVAIMIAGTTRPEGMAAVDIESLRLYRRSVGSPDLFVTKPALPRFETLVNDSMFAGKLHIPATTPGEETSAAQKLTVIAHPYFSSKESFHFPEYPIPTSGTAVELPLRHQFVGGTVYRFELQLVNSAGASAPLFSPFLIHPAEPLATPLGLSASYQLYPERVELKWEAVTYASGYLIYRDNLNEPVAELGAVTEYIDTAAPYGKDLSYAVRAIAEGSQSGFSNVAIGRREVLPAHSLRASWKNFEGEIRLTWRHAAAESGENISFEIRRRTNGFGPDSWLATVDNQLSYTDTIAFPNEFYEYFVVAKYGGFKAAPSAPATGRELHPTNPFGVRILEEDGLAPADNLVFTGTASAPSWDLHVFVEIDDDMADGIILNFDLNAGEPVNGSNFDSDVIIGGAFETGIHELVFNFTDADISGGFDSPHGNILGICAINAEGPKYASAFYPLLLEIPDETE